MGIELILIGLLILGNGFFAAAEMALVAMRHSRMQTLAGDGDHRATTVLRVRERLGETMAAVQVGVTLLGTLAAALSGAGAVRELSPRIAALPGLAEYGDEIAMGLVVVALSYLSLVAGELVPKRLAIRNAERTAMLLAGPLYYWSRLAYVPSRLLAGSTDLALRLLGVKPKPPPSTSQQEVELLIRQGTAEGIFEPAEQALIQGVFRFADGQAGDIMTPRPVINALAVNQSPRDALARAAAGFSRYPVYEDDPDHILGIVHVKDLARAAEESDLRGLIREACFVPGNLALPELFRRLQESHAHMAVVLDEHGGVDGLVTLEDLLEEIVGEIEDEHSRPKLRLKRLPDGTLLASGRLPVDEVAETLGIHFQEQGLYETLAGYVLYRLGRIPQVGDSFTHMGFVFTVSEMERRRVAWIQIAPASPSGQTT